MMVPRAFAHNPLAQRQQKIDLDEKDDLSGRRSVDLTTRPSQLSALSQSLSQRTPDSNSTPTSDPVRIPSRTETRRLPAPQRPGPSSLRIQKSVPTCPSPNEPRRNGSVQDLLSSTTIPIRRKPKLRSSQRLPDCDYVADFSKLLREDVPSSGDGSLSGSWTNPQFEGLFFGNIDGSLGGQMILGSEGVDPGILSTRSLSSESMPSLSSPDDFSTTDVASISPATVRSPSDQRFRQMSSAEDCSNQHPLLPMDEDENFSGTSSPEITMTPSPRTRRNPMIPEKRAVSLKSSLTASLKALKSAAQTVSNIASTPPLIQPDEFLTRSIFDFHPALTDDRRPPPSDELPSAALRRYLNPRAFVPPDSPAQLHFWVDEKPDPRASAETEAQPKLKIKKKYQSQKQAALPDEAGRIRRLKASMSQLPPLVPLATCIPSSIRTAHASSPPTWLEPDGTPSNKHRAAQTLWQGPEDGTNGEGQPRPREPRENRDFLRVFVCEMNMRKSGKLNDDAAGHARLWLPPVDEGEKEKGTGVLKRKAKKTGRERWSTWTSDDL